MIILDAVTKTVEVVLGGAITTNQLPVVVSFIDVTPTSYKPTSSDTISNSTNAVTIVAAPPTLTQRQVKLMTVYNADTVAALVTINYNDNATLRTLIKVTLGIGSTLIYTDGEGFRVLDATGAILGAGVAGANGATGPAGFGMAGLDGLDGQDGQDGFAGPTGLAGAAGATGPRGTPGDDGGDGGDDWPRPSQILPTPISGSWTPTITGNGGSSGQAYSVQIGRFYKQGPKVTLWGAVTLSTLGTVTGQVQIGGLPFPHAGFLNIGVDIGIWVALTTAAVAIKGEMGPGVTAISLFIVTAAVTGVVSMAQANLSATSRFEFSITYETTA